MRHLLEGLRALVRWRHVDEELNEELRSYLEAVVDENIASGMPPDKALRAARLKVGNLEAAKDTVRDVGWESRLDSLWRDVRYACRGLRRSPGFATVAILTLALGIGVNTAIFSVVNSLLLRALPVAAPEQLAVLSTRQAIDQGYSAGWNHAIWDQIRQREERFDGALAWTVFPQLFDLSKSGERSPADGLFVSWNFFEELGVPLLAGRGFTVAEDVIGSPESRVAVISYGFWQRHFGGAPDAVGQTLTVNRLPITIIGVAPPQFFGPEVGRSFDVAIPLGAAPAVLNEPAWAEPAGRSYLAVMLRLQRGQSIESASAMLRGLQGEIVEASASEDGMWKDMRERLLMQDPFALAPASAGTSELRRQYSRSLVTLMITATLVLLIACANVANLLLARSTAGRQEVSLRLALGASRQRVVQQLLVESLVLSGLGAMAGLLFARWGSRVLVDQLSTWFDRVVLDVSLDWRVLAFTAAASVATALLFGMLPAIRASRIAPVSVMKDALSDLRVRGRVVHLRGGLIAAQVGLSVVLLVAAGLFIRSFDRLGQVPLGFDSERVLVVDINTSRAAVDTLNRAPFADRLASAARAIPGVTNAAVSLNTPVNRGPTAVGDFKVPGGSEPMTAQRTMMNLVTPGWFETYGIPLKAGRVIDQRDTAASQRVVVANEAFAQRFLSGREAVGAVVVDANSPPGVSQNPLTIVGMVGNAVDQSLRADAYPTLYQPLSQFSVAMPMPDWSLSVRAASGSPALLARSVSSAITALDRNLAFSFNPLADRVSAARQQERLVAWLSTFFGGLALLLAAIGLHGVTAYTVERQRVEIGIRMALGAQREDVIALTVRHTLVMTICGVAVGLVTSAVLTRYLQTLLFGITPLDLVTFMVAPAALIAVALFACYLPARRATSIDPMIALRCE
jgi:putative ABC transport system permease protein